MRDWIVGYRKAAKNAGPGVGESDLLRYEEQAGTGMPEELRDLYTEMNGGELLEGVVLFSFGSGGDGGRVAELRPSGAWSFGAKGDSLELFAAHRPALALEANGAPIPEWVESVEDDVWLYGAKDPEKQQLRVYRTLEQMLATMIPPPQVEEFGDITYARALTAVRGAIETVRQQTGDATAPKAQALAAKKKAKAKAAPAKKKAAPAKKKAAKKKAKPAAKKKAPAKKKAAAKKRR